MAILLSSLKFGGAERAALNLARALRELGVESSFLLMSNEGEMLIETQKDFEVIDLRCNRTWKLPFRLSRVLRTHKPDILLSSFWKLNLCASAATLVNRRISLVLWEHSQPSLSENTIIPLYRITASILYRKALRIVCVSGDVLEDVASHTFGLRKKLAVVHNAIPGPPELTLPVSKTAKRKRVAWVGRLDVPKNPELLLDALSLVPPQGSFEVIYIGDGPLMPRLRARCVELGLEDRVEFVGFHPKPYELLVSCDLLVLTSNREGLGNVLVEAMHCGLGIVSTDCGRGIREVLGLTYGRIVPRGNPAALADAILFELSHPRDAEVQRAAASRFLPSKIAREFLTVLGYLPPKVRQF